MARAKGRRSKSSSKSSWWGMIQDWLEERTPDRGWFNQPWVHFIFVGMGGVALVLFVSYSVPKLEAGVVRHHEPTDISIRFNKKPGWMDGALLKSLKATLKQSLEDDPLNRDQLVEAHRILSETGWFAEIHQVRRKSGGVIEIDAEPVLPFTVVRDRDGDHVVDPAGRLLPLTYWHGDSVSEDELPTVRQIVVEGAHFNRPYRAGLVWEGADVAAALRVLALFENAPWREQIGAIDVSRYLNHEELQLVTTRGSRIHWGAMPGQESPGEVDHQRKIKRLHQSYREFGHIDAGYDGLVDITNPRGVFAQ